MTTYHLFKERIAKIYTADRHVVTWCGLNSDHESFCYTTYPKSADCLECKARELEHTLWKEFHSSIEKDIRNMVDSDLRSVITSTKLEDIGKIHAKDVLTAMVAANVSDSARRSVINQLHNNSMRAKAKAYHLRDFYPHNHSFHGKVVEYAGTVGVISDMYYSGNEDMYTIVVDGKIILADSGRNILVYPDEAARPESKGKVLTLMPSLHQNKAQYKGKYVEINGDIKGVFTDSIETSENEYAVVIDGRIISVRYNAGVDIFC